MSNQFIIGGVVAFVAASAADALTGHPMQGAGHFFSICIVGLGIFFQRVMFR